jgi:hypothetical protein
MKLFNRKWSNDGGTVTPLPPIATPNIVQQIIAREGQRPSYPSRENVVAAQSEITRLNTLIADTNKSIDHWTQKRNDAEASKNNCPKLFFGGIDTNTDCYRAREGDKNDAKTGYADFDQKYSHDRFGYRTSQIQCRHCTIQR